MDFDDGVVSDDIELNRLNGHAKRASRTSKQPQGDAIGAPKGKDRVKISISPPNFQIAEVVIIGTAPLVVSAWGSKADELIADQAQGKSSKSKKKNEARQYEAEAADRCYYDVQDGWCGVVAGSFRNACIRACSLTDVKMTQAKLAIFIEADGYDKNGTPLVRIHAPTPPIVDIRAGRNADGGVGIRARPMWKEWMMVLRIRHDADLLSGSDVCNLISRAGIQVGLCEGRPFSSKSNGIGWGTFRVAEPKELTKLHALIAKWDR